MSIAEFSLRLRFLDDLPDLIGFSLVVWSGTDGVTLELETSAGER
jgi:hypothetical protein